LKTSRKNIFDRLSLQKKIKLNRHNKVSDDLSSESIKNAELIEQIKDIQDSQTNDDTGLRSAYSLKSKNWYSQKLAEELTQKESKQKFIEKELSELKKKIAIEHQNMTKAETKANGIRRQETSLREIKRDLLVPKINKV
tara:strand:- start:223 stop:639 length:417 start_codon:yes stop_codon:yes gene_type:complete